MADLSTVELLTRAADVAGRAAAAAEYVATWYRLAELEREGFQPGEARLVAASGPDHWRAVEAMFRALLAAHPAYTDGLCVCGSFNEPCESLAAAVPLAEQVLQHLGDTA